jgi:exopolyphosphatase/guanosine-5'-triphosphate,3'-diphosphate pyrophosphatase
MPNFAVVDIGSNAIRLQVARVQRPGSYEVLCEERKPVRLGERVFLTGELAHAAMLRAIDALRYLREVAAMYQVALVRTVATSAVREASNADEFTRLAEKNAGLTVEVISGREEARLIHLGLRDGLPFDPDQRFLLIDIGGGSTEVSVATRAQVLASESLKLGAVRLTELFVKSDPIREKDYDRMCKFVRDTVARYRKLTGEATFAGAIGTAGTVGALAALDHKMRGGDVRPSSLSRKHLEAILSKLKSATIAERRAWLGAEPDRAEVIVAGAVVLRELMEILGFSNILISPKGLRDGVMRELAERTSGPAPARLYRDEVVLESVHAIGTRYRYDPHHARQVAKLALKLFQDLEPLHALKAEQRDILFAASLLHDIGQFVNYSKHHKHSYYLIRHSELAGFNENEVEMIANIARYHRRAHPSRKHPEYAALHAGQQQVVTKLSALLRIADAFDRSHRGLVTGLECHLERAQARIELFVREPLSLELWAFEQKSQLFSEVFDLPIVLQEHMIEAEGRGPRVTAAQLHAPHTR